jgi:hypothetical protein
VGYTKRGEAAEGLSEERRGCGRVILGEEVGYTKVREFAEGLYEEGRGQ